MLIYIASLTLYGAIDVIVHNLYLDIELISPVYFCDCEKCYEYPVDITNVGAMMKIDFRFDLDKSSGGILMYEVQRKGNATFNHQSSTNIISAETADDISKMKRLLVAWKIEGPEKLRVHALLVEHDNELVLNEDKLAQLHDKVNDIPSSHSLSIWLTFDNTALVVTYNAMQKVGLRLNITISKGAEDKHAKSALWIDSERQVSYLIVIYSMLIYIVSLAFQSAMDVIIDNQCSGIELTSPVHFTKNTVHHIHLPQQVNSKSRIKASFKTGMYRSTFGGVLLYHLQRKENDEYGDRPDKDISICTRLLVVWKFRIDRLYSHAWLIEHESTLVWSKDKLKKLYDVCDSLYDTDIIFNTRRWLLDENTMLQIICEASDEEDFEMNIVISEEKDIPRPQKPLRVDPDRYVPNLLMIVYIDLMLSALLFTMYSLYIFIIGVQISSWHLQNTLDIM
jgi:hypothetical protein